MSIKSKVIAAAAALTLIGGVGAAGAMSASAATPSCGPNCIDVFSKQFGTFGHPAFVLDAIHGTSKPGTKIILFRTSNSDPAEDFTLGNQGTVSDFFQANMVSAAVNLHYGCNFNANEGVCGNASFPNDFAFELEYAPFGVDSGLCAGVAATAMQNEGVTLQPCGITSKTVWIADLALNRGQHADSCITNPLYFGEIPLINGSDTNFSHPFVLTYPAAGFPTDQPRPQLKVANLTGFSQSGNALPCGGNSIVGPASGQLFTAVQGVLP